MWTLLLAPVALAGTLVIDARVPVEVWVDDRLIGQLAQPAEMHVTVDPGEVAVTLMIGGKPLKEMVQVPETGVAEVLVGRTGVTTSTVEAAAPAASDATTSTVEFRSAAREDMVLVVGKERIALAPGATRRIELVHGATPLSLRDSSGTVVWARGQLDVTGDGLVVQVADGRLPETAGAGTFHPDP